MFAIATSPPNWIISGSFSNCGAPPDIEIAVAIETALSTAAVEVAANAATQSDGTGHPARGRRARRTPTAPTAPVNAKFDRLNVSLSGAWLPSRSASPVPVSIARK